MSTCKTSYRPDSTCDTALLPDGTCPRCNPVALRSPEEIAQVEQDLIAVAARSAALDLDSIPFGHPADDYAELTGEAPKPEDEPAPTKKRRH